MVDSETLETSKALGRLTDSVDGLRQTVGGLDAKVDGLTVTVTEHNERISVLLEERQERRDIAKERRQLFTRWGVGIVLALGSAIAGACGHKTIANMLHALMGGG